MVVSNDCGPVTSYSALLTVHLLPDVEIAATPGETVCGEEKITLDAGPGFVYYLWSPGGQTTQTATVWASGTYTVKVIDAYGCEGKDSINIIIMQAGAPGDFDRDCDVDLDDYAHLCHCLAGPGNGVLAECEDANLQANTDIDLGDVAKFQTAFTSSTPP